MSLLELRNVSKVFRAGWFKKIEVVAVREVSLRIQPGEIFGLMGESGSGKSTLGKLALGQMLPSSGEVWWGVEDRLAVQGIAQNPYGAFNPRHRIGFALEEPLVYHDLVKDKQERRRRIGELLNLVGIGEECLGRYPGQLSGGQLQRLAIARILLLNPRLIVADEPTTMLDLPVQAQIIKLLKTVNACTGASILFISHDLHLVAATVERAGIMHGGRLVEVGYIQDLINKPAHPYTKLFVASALADAVCRPSVNDAFGAG